MSRCRANSTASIFPSMPRSPKPPGMTMPSSWSMRSVAQQVGDLLGLDPVHLDLGAVVEAGVAQRLAHRQVGVGEVHVLADHADAHRAARTPRPGDTTFSHPDRSTGWNSPSMASIWHTTRSRPSSWSTRGIS